MAASTTVTIRLDAEVSGKLDRIARETGRNRSLLAAQAVAAFVDHELEVVDGIRRGLADMNAGRVVPHEDVVAEGRAIITVEGSGSDLFGIAWACSLFCPPPLAGGGQGEGCARPRANGPRTCLAMQAGWR